VRVNPLPLPFPLLSVIFVIMSGLDMMAELQARQKARATAAPPPPPPPREASGSVSGPAPPPRPAGVPPPPPPRVQPLINTADGSVPHASPPATPSSGGPPPLPVHRPSVGPPPLPPGAVKVTPPVPPLPSAGGSGQHPPPPPVIPPRPSVLPRPPPPTLYTSPSQTSVTSSSTTGGDESHTPTAPETPPGTGHHSRAGSFSSTSQPPSAPLPPFSPSPSVITSPSQAPAPTPAAAPALPMPQLPPMRAAVESNEPVDAEAQTRRNTYFPPYKEAIEKHIKLHYLNDPAPADAPAEIQLDTSKQIKLASTVRVESLQQDNRFIDDFVPSIPPNAEPLVAAALTSFVRPIKALVKTHVKYKKVALPTTEVEKPGSVHFEIDGVVKTDKNAAGSGSSSDKGSSGASSGEGEKKKSGALADLFTQPTPDGDQQSQPASSPAGSSSNEKKGMSEEEKQAEIASLVNLSLQKLTSQEAQAAIDTEQATSNSVQENLFNRAHPGFDFQDLQHRAEYTIAKRLPPSMGSCGLWHRESGTQLLISAHQLRIGIGNVEPFFCSLALYDLKLGQRLTEDFHFDLNDTSLLTGQLEVSKSCADPITLCPHALFRVMDRHEHVVLLVKIERILQGDPDEMEHYFRLKQRATAEMGALVKKTRNNLIYLSDYRQTFGWGMLQLFDEAGEMRVKDSGDKSAPGGGGYARIAPLFQQIDSLKDDLFIQLMRDVVKAGAAGSSSGVGGKVYPGSYLDLRIEEMDDKVLPANRVDVSCIALKDTPKTKPVQEVALYNVAADTNLPDGAIDGSNMPGRLSDNIPPTPMAGSSSGSSHAPSTPASGDGSSGPVAPPHCTPTTSAPIPSPPIIREVEDFLSYAPPVSGSSSTPPTPHTSFINLLYLYPEMVKFEKYRNIACRVQFRTSDSNVVLEGMRVIRGKSSGSNFTLSALTQVNYHKKQVTPQDEVKIMLPLQLTPSTHIFFTFYKVSCKTKPGKREIIGYALLPLYNKNRLLVDDVYQLPIASKLPKNYLTPYVDRVETNEELHWRSSSSASFQVRVRMLSSLFSPDEQVYGFLHTFPNAKELLAAGPHHGKDLLYKAVEHVHRIHPWYTVKFLIPMLDYLFELIQHRSTTNLPGHNANQIQAAFFAFLGLTFLIERVADYYVLHENRSGSNRCSVLVAYINHRLDNLREPRLIHTSTSIPNAMGVEAGAGTTAASASPSASIPYVPLYAAIAKLWLVGLKPDATSDNAALFTVPVGSSSGASGATSPQTSLSSAAGSGSGSVGSTFQALHERLLIQYNWFFFEVMYKSLVLERARQLEETGEYANDDPNLNDFMDNMSKLLKVFVAILAQHRTVGLTNVKHLIHSLALFFGDLFSVLEKDRVIKLISTFLRAARNDHSPVPDPVLVEIKFSFYALLMDSEWFMDVCEVEDSEMIVKEVESATPNSHATTSSSPASSGEDGPSVGVGGDGEESEGGEDGDNDDEEENEPSGGSGSDLLSRLRSKYPLITLFLHDYISTLCRMRESLIRDKIVNSLRHFLTKLDYDARWQSKKSSIATMFMPLIPAMMDAQAEILRMQDSKAREGSSNGEHSMLSDTREASGLKQSAAASVASFSATASSSNTSNSKDSSASGEEGKVRRNILVCVLWVLKNTPLPLLRIWWQRDVLRGGHSGNSTGSGSRENSYSGGTGGDGYHNEGPTLDLLQLLDACIVAFPYAGVHKREAEEGIPTDFILTPEAINAQLSGGDAFGRGAGGVSDMKADIEAMMSTIHKARTFGSSTLRRASAAFGVGGDKNATLGAGGHHHGVGGGGTMGKSSLRQLRAQLSHKNATIGPGGVNLAGGEGGGTITAGGTIGRAHAAAMAAAGSISSGGTLHAHHGTLRGGRTLRAGDALALASHREFLRDIINLEALLCRNISRVVTKITHAFLEDYHTFVDGERKWTDDSNAIESFCHDTMLAIIKLFTSFVGGNQASSVLLSLYPTLLLFVQRYGPFFHLTPMLKQTTGHFCSVAFRVCAFVNRDVRQHAVALIYSLLTNNYRLDGDLFHLQMHLTISLSKLTENLSVASEKHLQASIQALVITAAQHAEKLKTEPETVKPGQGKPLDDAFKPQLDTLLGRLSTILSDSMEISRQSKLGADADSAISEALLLQIADAFSHIPEIRIQWLNRLAHHHYRAEQYAEAGQCYLLMAKLVTSKGSGVEGDGSSMLDTKTPMEIDKLLCHYYERAAQMLDKAELYEQCVEVYKLLQPIYHKYLDYPHLSRSHYHCHQVFEKLIEANRKQSRMLGTYYRVGFYGLKFGPRLHGQEFIYKMPKITRLSEIAARMKTLYSNQLGVAVKLLPDSNPVDINKLENLEEECIMQITFVQPSFPAVDAPLNDDEKELGVVRRPRGTFIEQTTALQCFKFSTPFTSGGKAFGSVTEQQKRNTVLYVKCEFPYILSAQPIVKRTETILNPIASATEDVILRTTSLLETVRSDTLNAKVLTGLLAGSVATQVHGGAKEICQAFLATTEGEDNGPASPRSGGADSENGETAAAASASSVFTFDEKEALKSAMRAFLDACVLGLEANKKLAEASGGTEAEKEFQANLEQQFKELTDTIQPLLREARRGKQKKVKKGVRFG